MTVALNRIPVDRITTQAREVRFARTVLTLIAAVFYAVGWVAAMVWLAVVWCGTAVKVGWQEASQPRGEGGP